MILLNTLLLKVLYFDSSSSITWTAWRGCKFLGWIWNSKWGNGSAIWVLASSLMFERHWMSMLRYHRTWQSIPVLFCFVLFVVLDMEPLYLLDRCSTTVWCPSLNTGYLDTNDSDIHQIIGDYLNSVCNHRLLYHLQKVLINKPCAALHHNGQGLRPIS